MFDTNIIFCSFIGSLFTLILYLFIRIIGAIIVELLEFIFDKLPGLYCNKER